MNLSLMASSSLNFKHQREATMPPPIDAECVQSLGQGLQSLFPRSLFSISIEDWFRRNILVSSADILAARDCSQQSDLWRKVRSNRITGSRLAVPLGHSYPYSPEKVNSKPITLEKAIKEFLWPDDVKGCAVNWGNLNEINARMVSEVVVRRKLTDEYGADNIKSITFDYPGTIVIKRENWVSISPDGLVRVEFTDPEKPHEDILLEFKCPYARNEFYDQCGGGIPLYYFDQIQGSMGFLHMDDLNIKRCFFSVWLRERTQISEFPYEQDYFEKEMFPRLRAFYFNELLPRIVLKDLGILKEGQVQLVGSSFPSTPTDASASSSSTASSSGSRQPMENPYKRKNDGPALFFPIKRPTVVKKS